MGLIYADPLVCGIFPRRIWLALPILGFASTDSNNHERKTVFFIHSWEMTDWKDHLYALFHPILYKGLENPQIWVSWNQSPHPMDAKKLTLLRFGGVRSYMRMFDCA